MDKTEDLLGIESPLYYRVILIEWVVKSNLSDLSEVYRRFVCSEGVPFPNSNDNRGWARHSFDTVKRTNL